jgi:hypothetical protein
MASDLQELHKAHREGQERYGYFLLAAAGAAIAFAVTNTALRKAAGYNIGCLTLDQVDGFNWCLTPGVFVKARHITKSHIYIQFPEGVDKTARVTTETGAVVPEEIKEWPGNIVSNNSDKLSFDEGTHRATFIMLEPPFLGTDQLGKPLKAISATFTIDFEVKTELAPFSFRSYADASSADNIANVAVASLPIGGDRTADMVLSTGKDGITVTLVPNAVTISKPSSAP